MTDKATSTNPGDAMRAYGQATRELVERVGIRPERLAVAAARLVALHGTEAHRDYRVGLFVRLNTAHEALMAAKHVTMGEGDVEATQRILAALSIVESLLVL